MREFFQSFTLNEGLTITIASLALIISVISFFNTSNRDKRQLRIGRIEEMIEIIHTLMANYQYYDDTFLLQQEIRLQNIGDETDSEKTRVTNLELKQVEALLKITTEINLRETLIRLSVLINAYLPNSQLRNRIRSLVSLYTSIAETTVNRKYSQTKDIFSDYPRPWILLPFVEKIQSDLIKEMKLGYTSSLFSDNPYDNEFKQELNL